MRYLLTGFTFVPSLILVIEEAVLSYKYIKKKKKEDNYLFIQN